jgi:hypothetical protein
MGPAVVFPTHALLVVEERLREQESEGVRLPPGMNRTELALRVLAVAALTSRPRSPLSPGSGVDRSPPQRGR